MTENARPGYYVLLYAAHSAADRQDRYDVDSGNPQDVREFSALCADNAKAQLELVQYVLANQVDLLAQLGEAG